MTNARAGEGGAASGLTGGGGRREGGGDGDRGRCMGRLWFVRSTIVFAWHRRPPAGPPAAVRRANPPPSGRLARRHPACSLRTTSLAGGSGDADRRAAPGQQRSGDRGGGRGTKQAGDQAGGALPRSAMGAPSRSRWSSPSWHRRTAGAFLDADTTTTGSWGWREGTDGGGWRGAPFPAHPLLGRYAPCPPVGKRPGSGGAVGGGAGGGGGRCEAGADDDGYHPHAAGRRRSAGDGLPSPPQAVTASATILALPDVLLFRFACGW